MVRWERQDGCLPRSGQNGFSWFQETLVSDAEIYLLKGRVRFLNAEGKGQHTPFSLMILTLGASIENKASLAGLISGRWMTLADPVGGS